MYKDRDEIILKALRSLKKNKNIFLRVVQMTETAKHLQVTLETDYGSQFDATFINDIFEAPRKKHEPQNLSSQEIVLLRAARKIFDLYNLNKAQTLTAQPSSLTNSANPKISKLDLHGTVYDLVDASSQCQIVDLSTELNDAKNDLAQAVDELDSAKKKVYDLEIENANLKLILNNTNNKLDKVIQVLMDKGITEYTEVYD